MWPLIVIWSIPVAAAVAVVAISSVRAMVARMSIAVVQLAPVIIIVTRRITVVAAGGIVSVAASVAGAIAISRISVSGITGYSKDAAQKTSCRANCRTRPCVAGKSANC